MDIVVHRLLALGSCLLAPASCLLVLGPLCWSVYVEAEVEADIR